MPHFSRYFSFVTRPHYDPARDWVLLLAASALALSIIVGWNVWAFKTVTGGGTLGAHPVLTASSTAGSVLDTLPSALSDRAAEDANYVNGIYRFADPSL
jgi:hypothetical protein